MNVFFIPSWYPDESNYVQGIFIKEQFEAMAEININDNFIISNVSKYNLPFKKPADAVSSYKKFKDSKKIIIKKLKTNLSEINNSALAWSEKLNGDLKGILKSHLENYLYAETKFGHIDLIHAHVSFPAGYIAMKLKEKFGIPYIITEHMGPFPFPSYLKNGKLTEKITGPLNSADKIIAVSSFLANTIESYTNIKPVVIPNLVNEDVFYLPVNPKNTEKNTGKISFLTVASLTESKGIPELLEAIKTSCVKNSAVEFTIAGTGDMEIEIIEFIKNNDLTKRVFLKTGLSRKEIVEEFKNCNAYILPSRHESFGVSFIEAMACGKPVIATGCGGPSDFVNKENGMLITVGNVTEIEIAILKMAENINSYNPEIIRKFFMENFSRKVVCSEIFSLYKEVLESNE